MPSSPVIGWWRWARPAHERWNGSPGKKAESSPMKASPVIHSSRRSLSGARCDDHEFPFARLDATDSGCGVCGNRTYSQGLPGGDRKKIPLLQLRRCDADFMKFWTLDLRFWIGGFRNSITVAGELAGWPAVNLKF